MNGFGDHQTKELSGNFTTLARLPIKQWEGWIVFYRDGSLYGAAIYKDQPQKGSSGWSLHNSIDDCVNYQFLSACGVELPEFTEDFFNEESAGGWKEIHEPMKLVLELPKPVFWLLGIYDGFN